jgi:hypothetical protein
MAVMIAVSHDFVDGLTARIERLVEERQSLRSAAAAREVLEVNRREICRLQHELSRALVAQYRPVA